MQKKKPFARLTLISDLLCVMSQASELPKEAIKEALDQGTVHSLLIENTQRMLKTFIRIVVSPFARSAFAFIIKYQPCLSVLQRVGLAGYFIWKFQY